MEMIASSQDEEYLLLLELIAGSYEDEYF